MSTVFNMQEILKVFCNAIDQVNPVLEHHHRRVAVIAYHLGKELELDDMELTRLVLATALHDIGALTVEDKKKLTVLDVENTEPHAKLGKTMLEGFDPFNEIAEMILYHHVNYEENKDNRLIPFESYIIHFADRLDIVVDHNKSSLDQVGSVSEILFCLRGTMFHPKVVDAYMTIKDKEYLWFDMDYMAMNELFERIHLEQLIYDKSSESIEQLIFTLSKIIDYKSEFTASHSKKVAEVSAMLGDMLGYGEDHVWELKMAAYMHDFGKIVVPSEILNKPGKLTEKEFNIMKSHPYFTSKILGDIKGFEKICKWAGSHHEKRDATGYPRKPDWEDMCEEVEIIIYADVFTALCETRPYREAMPLQKAMDIIEKEFYPLVGGRGYEVLVAHQVELYEIVSK